MLLLTKKSILIGAAALIIPLTSSAGALAAPADQTARDSAKTSVTPTELVFTRTGDTLTISYDAATNAAVVAKIKAKGLRGQVACTATGNTAASANVTWNRSKSSAAVKLVGLGDNALKNCRLSQIGDSADPVQVFFDATEAAKQATRVEKAVGTAANVQAADVIVVKYSDEFPSEKRIVRALRKANPDQAYSYAKSIKDAKNAGTIYVLGRSSSTDVYLAKKLSNGRHLLTHITQTKTTTKVI